MPDELPQTDGQLVNPSIRSEKSDASFGWVLGLILGAMVLAVVIFFMVLVFFHGEEKLLADRRKATFPLAPTPSRTLPEKPHLEPLDRLEKITSSDVAVREESKLTILRSYGPTPEKGYIHIPIDRAMQLTAGQLPVRKEPADRQDLQWRENGLVDHGESNSGRMFKRRNPVWFGK